MSNIKLFTIKISETSHILCKGYTFVLNYVIPTDSYILYELKNLDKIGDTFCFDTYSDAVNYIYEIVNNK